MEDDILILNNSSSDSEGNELAPLALPSLTPEVRDSLDHMASRSLFSIIAEGDSKALTNFLINYTEFDTTDSNGNTALILASERNLTSCVSILIKAGAKLDLQNNAGETALARAVIFGQLESVQLLIEAGASASILDTNGQSVYERSERLEGERFEAIRNVLDYKYSPVINGLAYLLVHNGDVVAVCDTERKVKRLMKKMCDALMFHEMRHGMVCHVDDDCDSLVISGRNANWCLSLYDSVQHTLGYESVVKNALFESEE